MRKVAIFTEGQGELIFVRQLIIALFGYEKASFECFELYTGNLQSVPYRSSPQMANIHFQIVNVGNDEGVLSVILERQENLIRSGFEIIGIRDMYSEAYKKRSHRIDRNIISDFIMATSDFIDGTNNSDKISFYYAIMELEAWLLSIYSLFPRINPILTMAFIEENCGHNLQFTNPETAFFHPASELDKILKLIGMRYSKSKGQMESIMGSVLPEDFYEIIENDRCNSYKIFFEKMMSMGQ